MTRHIAFLLGLLLSTAAQAQQVPNPMTKDAANALNPATRNNLGLGVTNIPQFAGLHIERPAAAATDGMDLNVYRHPNYAGGGPGINSAGSVQTKVEAGVTRFEWNLYAGLDNYATLANAAENVAFYAQAQKRSTGSTWGAVSQVLDYNTGVTSKGAIGLEINVSATGVDTSNGRVALEIYNNVTPSGVSPVFMRSDIALDGVFVNRNFGIEVLGDGGNYWFNLFGTSSAAKYYYGINLTDAICDVSSATNPGAQIVGSSFSVDCAGHVSVLNTRTFNTVSTTAGQGWLRLLSSGASNFIQTGLSETTPLSSPPTLRALNGSGAELSFTSINASATYLIIGPNGALVGNGTRLGAGTLNVQNGYYINDVPGVNCAAGTFVAATAIVTKGIVTRCN